MNKITSMSQSCPYNTSYKKPTGFLQQPGPAVSFSGSALQKQVGCLNHRVVTMVADKLKRQWLPEVFFGMEV